jgi:biotin carboxylase
MKHHRRILFLTTPSSYRAQPFLAAAERLGIEALVAEDTPSALPSCADRIALDFSDHRRAAAQIAQLASEQPLDALIAIDDSGSLLAAQISAELHLSHNALDAAIAARNKYVMRRMLERGGVQIPQFALHRVDEDIQALAQTVAYPCVVKPLELNGSRGVIRADTPEEFVAAVGRLATILRGIYPEGRTPVMLQGEEVCDSATSFLVEEFIPGFEVALEGLLDRGELQVLALFDKPDPLDGPFFEETIYITPSRHSAEHQRAIADCAARAVRSLGLQNGPVHAELRVNERGAWLVEAAGRSIGGLCSQTLQFGTDATLEELILRQACGLPVDSLGRTGSAGGVMMIPIPTAGVLRAVDGLDEARAVAGVESIDITAPLFHPIVALPEGESYLGFIFARGETPGEVEAALRAAHAHLRFTIMPAIPLVASSQYR